MTDEPAPLDLPPPLVVQAETPPPAVADAPEAPLGPAALLVTHIVDALQRYPGAPLTFTTRVQVIEPVAGFTLRISVPPRFWPNAFVASSNHAFARHEIAEGEGATRWVVWRLRRPARPGETFTYALGGCIDPAAPAHLTVRSEAVIEVTGDEGDGKEDARWARKSKDVRLGGVRVAHVAEAARRYPGEPLTLFTRVDALADLPGFTLTVEIPEGMTFVGQDESRSPRLLLVDKTWYAMWTVERDLAAGERVEFETHVVVGPCEADREATSTARVAVNAAQDCAEETASVVVRAQGDYLRYLPALYAEQDEFMGRFLMLFEHFWGPLDAMIRQIHHYFDPRLAPADLLPWLATWVDLVRDDKTLLERALPERALTERWPEAQRRQLIRSAVALYRTRGTKAALESFVELYTGVRPHIVEQQASGFRLGAETRLGPNALLGKGQAPYSFKITMQAPPTMGGTEAERRRAIERIIELAMPAQAAYTLTLRG